MECDLLMIKIEKVINKNDLKAFIAFPSSLYPDDPNWIPPLFIERNEHLSAKNPGTDHIIWQAWVAKKAGQIVGRITAQIDTLHRERYGEDTGHFGMIDAIDDPQVFAGLFGAAEAWLKSQGASKISGPFSLNINQESGLLIEGFDTPPCAMMPHGKPWYAAHIEQLGYHKGIDLLAWWMQRTGHFGMIDAIDDPQVFAALFGAAEAWLKSQGASKISGPFSLNINQERGLLIEGFDTPPCAMMPHGKPWYAAHIEQLGYHKGIDLLAWWMQRTDLTFSPALKKLN